MTNSVQETFNVPPDFSVEEINSQLYYEDLEEDDEIWLVRMPCDVEMSTLDKQKIFLSNDAGGSSVRNIETESGQLLECYAETCDISSTCVVLPKKQTGDLRAVKKAFKGAILISEGLALNNEQEIKSEKEDINSCPIVEPNGDKVIKKKKHSHIDQNRNEMEEETDALQFENVSNSSSKKKKSSKKTKHMQVESDSSNLNNEYETEAVESFDSPNLKVKHKKHSSSHRKLSEKLVIKEEPMSTNWDGFPTCFSQK